jgi:hypothetical protein
MRHAGNRGVRATRRLNCRLLSTMHENPGSDSKVLAGTGLKGSPVDSTVRVGRGANPPGVAGSGFRASLSGSNAA